MPSIKRADNGVTHSEVFVHIHMNALACISATNEDYITKEIQQVDCAPHAYKAKHVEKAICHCGRLESWENHQPSADPNYQEFNKSTHLSAEPCTSYGEISFQGFGAHALTRAKYIRVGPDTDPSHLWNILTLSWEAPRPKLIISVTGGANIDIKPRLVASFKRGLINAATSTDAWIITGGTNKGVMSFAGEAVREHTLRTGDRVVALGIASWGIVDNKECLNGRKGARANYKSEDLELENPTSVCAIDPNHTHFILVDNGIDREYGVEINLRAQLEEHISNSAMLDTGVHVPVVSLVLGGGENTILTAAEACEKGTPIVVVKDSGRAADLIALAFNKTQNSGKDDETIFPSDFDDYVRNASRDKLSIDNRTVLDNVVKNIRWLLKKQNKITVFSLAEDESASTKDMDKAILFALLKANRAKPESQLNLALAWDCADIAQKKLFTPENRPTWKHTNHLNDAMEKALVQDRPAFVQLLIDNGVVLSDFVTINRLDSLYRNVMNASYPTTGALLLKESINEDFQKTMKNEQRSGLRVVGNFVSRLLSKKGQHIEKFYQGFSDVCYSNGFHSRCTGLSESEVEKTVQETTSELERSIDPERELFIWAVLLNRQELALQFWKNGKDHIGGALFASSLLGALSKEAKIGEEVDHSLELEANAHEFQMLGVNVLNECYKRDKVKSHQLLTRELDTWGKTTLFSLANDCRLMDFMGHSACQSKLNRVWMGKMALHTPVWKILVGLIMPLMVLSIKFTTNKAKCFRNATRNSGEENSGEPNASTQNTCKVKSDEKNKVQKLYKATLACGCANDNRSKVCFLVALTLYHATPFVKFCYHVISYVVYLCLFSFFLLTDLHPDSVSIYEYLVWAWSITLILDEGRQLYAAGRVDHFNNLWNVSDCVIFVVLVVSVVLRLALPGEWFVWARMLYVITLAALFLRSLQFFCVQKTIGPKVVMIRGMITDLMFFLLLLATVIFAYGVSKQALLDPNATRSWDILRDVISQPFWSIYGELFQVDMFNCTNDVTVYQDERNQTVHEYDPDVPRCPILWLAMILNGVYMLVTNVLLLNLLIAMFSYTFTRVQNNSEKVYRFHRYDLVYEYFDKPTLAPPLIVICQLGRLLNLIHRRISNVRQNDEFHTLCSEGENHMLTAFERAGMENYLILKQSAKSLDAGAPVTPE